MGYNYCKRIIKLAIIEYSRLKKFKDFNQYVPFCTLEPSIEVRLVCLRGIINYFDCRISQQNAAAEVTRCGKHLILGTINS